MYVDCKYWSLILRLTIPSFYCHSDGYGGTGSSSSDGDANFFAYADLLDLYAGRRTAEAVKDQEEEEERGEEGEDAVVSDEVRFTGCEMKNYLHAEWQLKQES